MASISYTAISILTLLAFNQSIVAQGFSKNLQLNLLYGYTSTPTTPSDERFSAESFIEGNCGQSGGIELVDQWKLRDRWFAYYGGTGSVSELRFRYVSTAAFNPDIDFLDGEVNYASTYGLIFLGANLGISYRIPLHRKTNSQLALESGVTLGYHLRTFPEERRGLITTNGTNVAVYRVLHDINIDNRASILPEFKVRYQHRLNARLDWNIGLRGTVSSTVIATSQHTLFGDPTDLNVTTSKTATQYSLLCGIIF